MAAWEESSGIVGLVRAGIPGAPIAWAERGWLSPGRTEI